MANETTTLPDPLITSDPDRLGGTPCFTGTRVPVKTLFDFLEDGAPLDEFLRGFPNVTREMAVAVLRASKAALVFDAMSKDDFRATPEDLAAIDEARAQIGRGERAADEEVRSAFALFRS